MKPKKPKNNTAVDKTKILIVDDHPIVRHGLANLINHEDDLLVCGQAEDSHQAMTAIKKLKPDMVIVDISLKETSGMELIKDINVNYPDVAVLVLSMHDETLYAERALRAGAKGYLMKHHATDKVITAIQRILGGQVYVSDMMAVKMVRKLVVSGPNVGQSAIEKLSDRELEVFRLIGHGHGTRQIAQKLHLSIKTIETYRAHIKEKLNLANASELLKYAIAWVNSEEKV
jgi:DNA-binding NarL/FixJ family response regulator